MQRLILFFDYVFSTLKLHRPFISICVISMLYFIERRDKKIGSGIIPGNFCSVLNALCTAKIWNYCIIIHILKVQNVFLCKYSHKLLIHNLTIDSLFTFYRMLNVWRRFLLVDRSAFRENGVLAIVENNHWERNNWTTYLKAHNSYNCNRSCWYLPKESTKKRKKEALLYSRISHGKSSWEDPTCLHNLWEWIQAEMSLDWTS